MASILKVDDLRGNTAAGNITITSEGGSATMQLQQGLAKAWMQLNGTGTIAVQDSFNTSSVTDNTSGDYQQNYTNALSNDNYSGTATSRRAAIYKNYGNTTLLPTSASSTQVCVGAEDVYSGETPFDSEWVHTAIHGDLA